MECNKEDAIRARRVAEEKLQEGDFESAKKFALKAQKMFPELENISQLLTVCNVHYHAKNKLFGSEMDWYGILQVEKTAEETFIKKQYRKLALLLHPDKNKFAGAEAAFKLIGQANMVLSDQTKRSQYDLKCRISLKTAPKSTSHPSNRAPVNSRYYQNGSSNFAAPYPYHPAHLSFWTVCTTCGIKYQYYKDFMNKLLMCPSCRNSFIARDLGPQHYSPSQFSNQKAVPNQGPCKVSSQSNGGTHFPHGVAGSAHIPKAGSSVHVGEFKKRNVDGFSNARDGKKGVDMPKSNAAMPKESKTSRNAKKKRGRKSAEESDESFETGSESETEDAVGLEDCEINSGMNSKANAGHPPRRSSRQKQHISYEEKLIDDDDFVSPPKRSKANEEKVGVHTVASDKCQKEVKRQASSKAGESKVNEEEPVNKTDEESAVNSGSESDADVNPIPQVLEYPDPEFSDFEKQREENCFAVDQVWAIYETLDGMPRFYARIKKVFNRGFKLRITWLEADPDEENELNWVDQELPVSCGKYRNGKTETCEDRLMFSHQVDVDPIKPSGRCFLVYPKKGETWALFKDWDTKWASEPENHKPPYQYEFVEVLTDFDEEIGIRVAPLVKVKGFVSIFRQTARLGFTFFQVSPQELYRFSHRIPSFRMTGKEREGVPVGSFELDPASLPTDFFESVDPCEDMRNCSRNQTKGSSTSVDAVEKISTPKRSKKNDVNVDCLKPRRSPRDLSKKGSQVNANQHNTPGKKH